ncbi:MAG: AI-2E family transporter [Anaerolineales bacterium]|nr:AI-2E family transporter [Anaerolineales bacterium]
MTNPNPSSSPPWSSTGKRVVWLILLAIATLAVYRIRALLLPLTVASILAYLIHPLVHFLTERTPLNRLLSIALIYLIITAGLVSIPVSAISPVVNQANTLIQNVPGYIEQIDAFFQKPLVIANSIEIPIDQLSLNQPFSSIGNNLVDLIQTIGGQTLTIFSSLATATISTVGWIIMILFVSFYLVKDYQQLFQGLLRLTPAAYHDDLVQLLAQINITWHAFLRGQLVLCVVVGTIFFIIALIIDLPNALILAIIAGLMELIPTFGPILAAVPAVIVALFQSEASWLGQLMTPFWFGLLMAIIYGFIYQFENYVLVPRIIGHHLKLHPLAVVLGVLVGASLAGVLGILLAAPVLATIRLILRYIYWKLTDQEPFAETAVKPLEPIPIRITLQKLHHLISTRITKGNNLLKKGRSNNENG